MRKKRQMGCGEIVGYWLLGALAALGMLLGAIDLHGGAVVLQFFGGVACLIIGGILGDKAG